MPRYINLFAQPESATWHYRFGKLELDNRTMTLSSLRRAQPFQNPSTPDGNLSDSVITDAPTNVKT
ncbi:MAG: hypothetical protein OXE92_03040 [Bacteroidetes bacterium]|nr:hypothetical protein [Bacteroidota bacterium]